MKILHVLHRFPPRSLGGTEINVYLLARAQAKSESVAVAFPGGETPTPSPHFPLDEFQVRLLPASEGPTYRKFLDPLAADPGAEREAIRILNEVDPDIVHVHQLQDVPVRLVETALEQGRRVFFTLRDFWYLCARTVLLTSDQALCEGPHPDFRNCERCWRSTALQKSGLPRDLPAPFAGLLPVAQALRRRFERFRDLLNRASTILVPSRFVLEKHAEYGVRRDRLRYVQNGVDVKPYSSFQRTKSDRVRFGYMGSLTWDKGVHVAVRAARSVKADLTIFGPFDPDLIPYHAELRNAGAGEVRFAGRFENPAEALSRMDCLIVPSLWYENCPGVILQARATRTPVIASDLGALPEMVEPGASGLLFRPGDAEDLARRMSQASDFSTLRSWAERIRPPKSIEENAEEVLTLYRRGQA